MLTRAGRWMTRAAETDPFTNVIGAARTLLALGTLLTLAVNSSATLFIPVGNGQSTPVCRGIARHDLFCVADPHTEIARWGAAAILLVVLTGWRPRWTALPHAYVAFSVQNSVTVTDGGDQVTLVLTVLLLPLLLCDGRRNHWHAREPGRGTDGEAARAARFAGLAVLLLVKIQMAGIYFNSGVAKLGVREWADGTAMYYWLNDPTYGAPPWQHWFFDPFVEHGVTVALFSWGVIIGEVTLAAGLLLPRRVQRYLLVCAIAFHAGIALVMGLISFGFAMSAGCVLYLWPVGEPFPVRRLAAFLPRPRALGQVRGRRPRAPAPGPAQPDGW